MNYAAVSVKANSAARWIAVALGFSIPVSTALDNILLSLLLACWLAGLGFRDKLQQIKLNPVAVLALVFFALLVAAAFYGGNAWADRLHYLNKYREFLLIPLFVTCYREPRTRQHGITALAAALVLTLLFSYAIGLGLLPEYFFMRGSGYNEAGTLNAVAFKLSITHGILMALGAFLFAQLARVAPTLRMRVMWSGFALLALFNVLFMVQGRTGYLILAVLLVYFCFTAFKWKGLAAAIAGGTLLFGSAYFAAGTFHSRIDKAVSEFSAWQPQQAAGEENSVGLRMEWYKNSLDIVREHPIFGAGTGGFPKAYAEKTLGSGKLVPAHPHNEYLLIAVQLGLVGLALLFYLFYRQWRLASSLPLALEQNLARGLLLTIIFGCLFNSLLVDHTEGLLYAWLSGLLYGGLNSSDNPANMTQ